MAEGRVGVCGEDGYLARFGDEVSCFFHGQRNSWNISVFFQLKFCRFTYP